MSTIVEHYTSRVLTCDDVLEAVGVGGMDDAADPIEVLGHYFGIDCCSAFLDDEAAHSGGGGPVGWEEEGTRALYEVVGDGREERVVADWWSEMAAALGAGHPTFLLGERLEQCTVRHAKKRGNSFSHCLLIVGFEGTPGAPRSSDRRGDGDRGTRTAPRLLIKDPCNAERLLEATFESAGAAVQLQLFHDGGRSSLDRFRVTGSVQLSGVMPEAPRGAAVDEGVEGKCDT